MRTSRACDTIYCLRSAALDYIEWVERVFAAAMAQDDGAMGFTSSFAIAAALGFDTPTFDDFARRDDPRLEGLLDALADLDLVGIEMPGNLAQLRVTDTARDVREVGLRRAIWPRAHQPVLDARSERLLIELVARSVEAGADYARLRDVPLGQAWAVVADTDDGPNAAYNAGLQSRAVLGSVVNKGLARSHGAGVTAPVLPTLLGVIRATAPNDLDWQERLDALAADWETTSVEFKRELDLRTDEGKRRLVRSVLALATTKTSGPSYLVIGFDPVTHTFTTPVDSSLSADRIEDVLAAYTDPVPEVHFRMIRRAAGDVGLVEVVRQPAMLPYRVKKAMRGLAVHDVVVRHGSHIEPPSQREMDDLIREGRLARGEPADEPADE